MRAVRYHEHGGPEVLQVDEIDRPTPAAGEILVHLEHFRPAVFVVANGSHTWCVLP